MRTTAKERQTLIDIALRQCGTVEAVMDVALLNGISLTAVLDDGAVLELPATEAGIPANITRRYEVDGVEPATEVPPDMECTCPYGGISRMGIEIDFVVY